jgi:DNA polymerase eta
MMVSIQEKASIDEAFIDFTRPVREMLVERYPYLAHVPSDAPNGLDSPLPPPPPISWDGLGIVIATTNTAPESADGEDIYHEDDESTSWHDVALSIAAELMGKIRDEVHTKLGYTTSAVRRGSCMWIGGTDRCSNRALRETSFCQR